MVGLIDTSISKESIPTISCSNCGRRMQFLSSNPSTHSFVCYHEGHGHPTYFNYHYSLKLDEGGKIAVREPRASQAGPK